MVGVPATSSVDACRESIVKEPPQDGSSQKLSLILSFFLDDLSASNERFIDAFNTFSSVWEEWVLFFLLLVTIAGLLSLLLQRRHLSSTSNSSIVVKILLLCYVSTPVVVPERSLRFFFGLQTFSGAMSCFSQHQLAQTSDSSELYSSSLYQLFAMFYYDLPRRMKSLAATDSILYELVSAFSTFAFYGLLVDFCTYLVREYIPVHFAISTQARFFALVGGIWVLCCLAFVYSLINIGALFLPPHFVLPPRYLHHCPLLSVSLAEFWGVRWNPVIGKQLQECFYLPTRSLFRKQPIVARILAMFMTFTGSAVLHAWPVFLGTFDAQKAMDMGSFFVFMGVAVLIEHAFCSASSSLLPCLATAKLKKHMLQSPPSSSANLQESNCITSEVVSTKKQKACETVEAHEDWAALAKTTFGWRQRLLETLVVVLVVTFFYLREEATLWLHPPDNGFTRWLFSVLPVPVESSPSDAITSASASTSVDMLLTRLWILWTSVALVTLSQMYHLLRYLHARRATTHVMVGFIDWSVVQLLFGWLWTLVCVVGLLPRFALPVLHCVETIYARSFVVGSLLRTLCMVLRRS